MATRYSQIKRGAEYDTALDNYVQYLRDSATRPTKRLRGGSRENRRALIRAAVRPFGLPVDADELIEVKASAASGTALGPTLGVRLIRSGAELASAQSVRGFRPARLSAFRGTGAAEYAQSKVTKLWYLKYAGDSFSLPFGALTETEEQGVAARALKAQIITFFGSAEIKRVSIAPEKVPT